MNQIYSKNNNIFQSKVWQDFQESIGRKTVMFEGSQGFLIPLVLGKNFLWFFKGPEKVTPLFLDKVRKENVVFARIEPGTADDHGSKPRILTGQASPGTTRVINLNRSEEEILAGMKSRVRYNIRLAERKGLKVVFSTEQKDVALFYETLKSTEGRGKGFAPHPKEYYEKLFMALAKNKAGKIALGYYENKLIYAGLFSVFGKTAIFMHSGFSDDYASLKAPNYCLWQIIKESKEMGAEHFDMWGIADSDDPKHPWYGISQFKESFGGEVLRFPGTYDIVNSWFWYQALSLFVTLKNIFAR